MKLDQPSHRVRAFPVALYLILATTYLFAIPTGESPDEPSHLQCIEQVARDSRIPVIDPQPQGDVWWARERIISGLVCAHMPLYYFMTGYTLQITGALLGQSVHFEFPPNNPVWADGQSPAMFTHASRATFFELDAPATLTLLRVESILLGLTTLWSAAVVARRLAPESPRAPPIAMMLAGGWPQFLFMSRAINNDVLAVALSVSAFAVLLDSGQPRRYIAVTALTALAILSKFTMVFTAIAVVLVYFLEAAPRERRSAYVTAGLISLFLFSALGALILLQPTLRANLEWTRATMAGIDPRAGSVAYWLDVAIVTLQSGWARFGWMSVLTPDALAYAWWALLGFSGTIGALALWRRPAGHETRFRLLLCAIWAAALIASYVSINVNRFQPQFRYIFPVIPLLAGLAAAGITTALKRHEGWQRRAAPLLGLLLLAANLWLIFAIVAPAYA